MSIRHLLSILVSAVILMSNFDDLKIAESQCEKWIILLRRLDFYRIRKVLDSFSAWRNEAISIIV